jgi:hypothetical protein
MGVNRRCQFITLGPNSQTAPWTKSSRDAGAQPREVERGGRIVLGTDAVQADYRS